MTLLYIARHGQTEENVRRVLQGQMPGHLTTEGVRQAEELRERLRSVRFDRIVTSDLKRAVDTTRIVSQPHGGGFLLEPLLRERDFGIHTGGPYLKISHALDPSAETMEQVAGRAAAFLNMIARSGVSRVLAISHGLYLRVLQAVYRGVGVREIEKMDNAEVRVLPIGQNPHFSPAALAETGGRAN